MTSQVRGTRDPSGFLALPLARHIRRFFLPASDATIPHPQTILIHEQVSSPAPNGGAGQLIAGMMHASLYD